jgi:prefoldin subunit 5
MKMKTLEKRIETLTATIETLTDELHEYIFNNGFYNSTEHSHKVAKIEALEEELETLQAEYNHKETFAIWVGGLFLTIIAIVSGLMLYMIQ